MSLSPKPWSRSSLPLDRDKVRDKDTQDERNSHNNNRGFRRMHSLPEPCTPPADTESFFTSTSSSHRGSLRKVPSFSSSKKSRPSSRMKKSPSPTTTQQSYHEFYDEYTEKYMQTPIASHRLHHSTPLAQIKQEYSPQEQYSPPLDKPPLPVLDVQHFQDNMIRRITSVDTDDYPIQVSEKYEERDECWKDDLVFQHDGSVSSSRKPHTSQGNPFEEDEFPHLLAKALEEVAIARSDDGPDNKHHNSRITENVVKSNGAAVSQVPDERTGKVRHNDSSDDTISKNLMSANNMIYLSGSDDDNSFPGDRDGSDDETVWSDFETSTENFESPDWTPKRAKATGRPRREAFQTRNIVSTMSSSLEELASPPVLSSDDEDETKRNIVVEKPILRIDTSDSLEGDRQSNPSLDNQYASVPRPDTWTTTMPPPSADSLRFRPPAFRLNAELSSAKASPLISPQSNKKESDGSEQDNCVGPLPQATSGKMSPLAIKLAKKSHFASLADEHIHNNSPVLKPNVKDSENRKLFSAYPPPPPINESSVPLATNIHTKSSQSRPHVTSGQHSFDSVKSGSVKSNTGDTDALNVRSQPLSPARTSRSKSPPRKGDKNSSNNSRSPPRSRIDTAQMPRPRPTKSTIQNPYVYHTKLFTSNKTPKSAKSAAHYLYHDSTLTPSASMLSPTSADEPLRKCPPMSTAEYVSVDTGNATPRYIRMTTYAPPVNKTLHTASALPFVAHVTPFALPENDEMDIPLVDFGEASGGVEECSDPLRCSNCEGFINPHVSWVLGGEQWECNLCCHRNRTPSWYFSPLKPNGRRADEEKGHRPELTFGSVDMKVSNAFCPSGTPQIPTFVFIVDVSAAARTSGIMGAELKALKNTLDSIYEWLRAESSDSSDDVSDCGSVDDKSGPEDEMRGPEDRSGASLNANVSSAQATYGKATPLPGADSNGLFSKHTGLDDKSENDAVGPIRIGIVTFDSSVHYYSVKENSPDPLRVMVVDANDPFSPLPKEDWILPLYHNKDKIDLILSSIPTITKPKDHGLAPQRSSSAGSKEGTGGSGVRSPPLKSGTEGSHNSSSSSYRDPSIPPPPITSLNAGVGNSTDNIYRMQQPVVEPVRISSKTTILPGKAGLLRPTHSSSDTKPALSRLSVSSSTATPSLCPVAAVAAVTEGLGRFGGGRVILMTSSNASKGVGRTTRTPQSSDYGTEKEFPFYSALEAAIPIISVNDSPSKRNSNVGVDGTIYPGSPNKRVTELDAYLELKKELVSGNICLEVFFFVPSLNHNSSVYSSQQQISPSASSNALRPRAANSAVFSELTRATGGNLHLFSGSLLLEDNLLRFNSELLECIQSIAASEVTMKLQCSNGLKATDYYGCGDFDPKRSEVKVGGLDRQSSSCFVLSFDSDSFLDMGGFGSSVTEAASDYGILDNLSNLLKGIKPSSDTSFGAQSNSPISNATLSSNSRAVRSSASRKKGIYNDGEPLYLQLSITYTAQPSGERIVRVHNMELFTAADPAVVFRFADCHCLATFLCKQAAFRALHVPLSLDSTTGSGKTMGQDIKNASGSSSPVPSRTSSSNSLIALSTGSTMKSKGFNLLRSMSSSYYSPRLFLIDSCLEILMKYRTLCSSHSPKGQLILPESLKVLPLYILGMLKHPFLLKNGHTNTQTKLAVDCCERSYELTKMLTQPVRDAIFTLYPRLYPLHNLQPDEGYPIFEEDEFDEFAAVLVPRWLKCSAEVIDSEGIYLLDDGTLLWLYIGRCVKQSVIKDLMGLSAGTHNPPGVNAKPASQNPFSNATSGRTGEKNSSGRILDRSGSYGEKKTPIKSPHGSFLRSLSSGGDRPRRRSSRSSTSNASIGTDFNEDRDPSHSILPGFVGIKPLLNIESEFANRVTRIIDTVRESHTHKPELKIVWGGEVNSNSSDVLRFGLRMIEDSIYGCQSYSDHLCEIHSKIQSML